MSKPKLQTEPPATEPSTRWSKQLERLVEHGGRIPPNTTLDAAVGPLLEILAETQDRGAAGIRVVIDGAEQLVERRATVGSTAHSGVPPRHSSMPPRRERMFHDLAVERRFPFPHPPHGALHFAAPEDLDDPSFRELLERAATLIHLVVRGAALGSRETDTGDDMAQLQKLATLGQTASQVVHELNNPLTAIIAYSDFLTRRMRERSSPEGEVDRLLKINEAATRIQRLCRQLTDYSRPASSLSARVDLREVIDSALSFCAHGLRTTDVAVERVYREIPAIEGVDTALIQVFVNLITNAWHAMPDGGTLSLRTHARGGLVIAEVADEGEGIPVADRARIFDAYFTTKPKGTGVGLGLSIVKQIVNEHQGEIRAEARAPRGTVFVISFPARGRL